MKRIIYISSMLLLACVAFISCVREDKPFMADAERLILFTAESEWPAISKATLFDGDDIITNGFKVWGKWHQDPEDNSNYDYDEDVFGTNGTLVLFSQNEGAMIPENEASWHRGYYNFVGIFPSQFSAIQYSSFDLMTEGTKYTNVLTFNLGIEGFNLANKQIDLMYAFGYADNSNDEASSVALNFNHAFAKININLAYTNVRPTIQEVHLYGIHSTIRGNLQYRQDVTDYNKNASIIKSDNMAELLASADISSHQNPYVSYKSFNETSGIIRIAEDLLVFPETLSQYNALRILIKCLDKDIYTEVNSGVWEPGHTYTYVLSSEN